MRFPVRTLTLLIVLFMGTSALINAGLFSFRVYEPVKYRLLPPGYVIGTIWMALIGAMAYSQFLVMRSTASGYVEWLIPGLFLYCIMYPFYTSQFQDRTVSQYANLGSILVSFVVAVLVYRISAVASALIAWTTVWASYATWATFDATLFSLPSS